MEGANAEKLLPASWEQTQQQTKPSEVWLLFRRLLLLKGLRGDRVIHGGAAFVAKIFGEGLLNTAEFNLAEIVDKEVNSSTPLILCSQPGYDAGWRVDDLARSSNKQYKAIAIGSAEGFEQADKVINAASKQGTWVLLKNVHLAPRWLVQLEKKLHTLTPHAAFRLFMTAEIHPKLPPNLLRQSHIMSFEPPPGVKANLQHSFANISAQRMDKAPAERARLYFLVAWFHSVVQERLRYVPIGWSKTFEFNESDQRCAYDTMDYWIDLKAQGKTNIAPEQIPWEALRTILAETVYGGRIDNEFDQRLLQSFLTQLFTPKSFDLNFPLVKSKNFTLPIPEGRTRADFVQWIEKLPAIQAPYWLGLPDNAELMLLTNEGRRVIAKLLKLQSTEEEEVDDGDDLSGKQQADGADRRPAWVKALHKMSQDWLAMLPAGLKPLQKTAEKVKDPLFRSFEREVRSASGLLAKIRRDLAALIEVCQGNIKQTNYLRGLMGNLSKGVIPKEWLPYHLPDNVTLNLWLVDFIKRIKQLEEISKTTNYYSKEIWLGGLLMAEAFMTATRQAAAQANGWSLENLELQIDINDTTPSAGNQTSFIVSGLTLEGAGYSDAAKTLVLTDSMRVSLPLSKFTWREKSTAKTSSAPFITLPVYLDETRRDLLFSVDLNIPADIPPVVWHQRSVAITAWSDIR